MMALEQINASDFDTAVVAIGDSVEASVITATVRDSKETVTCRLNDTGKDGAEKAFEYKDRTKTLFQGTDVYKRQPLMV